jgi:hypothetical protein
VEAPAVALRFVAPKFLKVRVGDKPPNTMTDVKLLDIVLALAAILGALRIWYFVRSRAMRRLASKWDFRYIGPTAPPRWWDISRPTIRAPLPSRLGSGIAQAWNIIEGEYSGRRLFIFDGLSGGYSSQPRTQIACETEQNPFPLTTSIETVSQIRGWTVLDGVWFLWFSWLMSIKRLERHLRYLSE